MRPLGKKNPLKSIWTCDSESCAFFVFAKPLLGLLGVERFEFLDCLASIQVIPNLECGVERMAPFWWKTIWGATKAAPSIESISISFISIHATNAIHITTADLRDFTRVMLGMARHKARVAPKLFGQWNQEPLRFEHWDLERFPRRRADQVRQTPNEVMVARKTSCNSNEIWIVLKEREKNNHLESFRCWNCLCLYPQTTKQRNTFLRDYLVERNGSKF